MALEDYIDIGKYAPVVLVMLCFDIVVLICYKALLKKALKRGYLPIQAILRTLNQTFFVSQLFVVLPLCVLAWYRKSSDKPSTVYLENGLEQCCIFMLFFLVKNIKRLLLRSKIVVQKKRRKTLRNLSSTLYFALIFWALFSFEKTYVHQLSDHTQTSFILGNVLQLYTIWCVVGMLTYVLHIMLGYIGKRLQHKPLPLGKALLEAAHWPLIILCGGFLVVYTLQILSDAIQTGPGDLQGKLEASKFLSNSYRNILLLAFIYTMYRLTRTLQQEFLSGNFTEVAPSKTMVVGLGGLSRIVLGLIFAVVCWNMLSEKAVSIDTILGSTGFGLALAVRPIIENYVAGAANYFEGGYKIGDWIYFTDKKIEGVIEEIKARVIVLRTFDKRILYVPHSLFLSNGVVNASRMTHRRVKETIPVGWITDTETLEKILFDTRNFVYNSPDLDKTQALMVHFTGFGEQGLNLSIYALTKTRNWHASLNVQEHILKETKKIIEKHAGAPPVELRSNYAALPPNPTDFPTH